MKKITLLFLILSALSGLNQARAQNKIDKNTFTGSWLGKLEVSAISLRIVFNLAVIEKDSLVATMDSPDQGAKDIKLGPVIIDNENIKISAPLLLGEYTGTIKNDTIIEGTWTQRGNTLPLNLTKLRKAFAVNRPQEPKPPFPYATEDVKFTNEKAGINLAGTLTIPQGEGPFPAVILITGSGSQNRNEELLGHKPFWVIADHLSRNGIAVLRYDDRGVGQSQGTPVNVTSADFADDAEAAFLYLRARKEIKTGSIGFAGHSEGGLIASIVASKNSETAFTISLAGPGVAGDQIMHRQNRDISLLSGADEADIKKSVSTNKKLFSVLKKETDNKKAEVKIAEVYRKALAKENKSPEEIDKALKQLNASLNPVAYDWLRYFILTDPAVYWKKVKGPVLALNGEKDLQVAADINLPAIEKALKSGGNLNVMTMKLPELNHLFQHSKTGLPAEYGEIEETFAPEVLKIMSDWIHGL
jgi:pimeloyl-ACP methyl ester carboxylesterase